MNIKKILPYFGLIILAVLFINANFKGEKDPLHKRIFTVGITEVKDGQPAKKSISDKIEFKDGRLFSDFLFDKFQYKWIKYRINKDSIYTDETETEVRLFEVEASTTDDKDQTLMMTFNIVEWDIEGVMKITKNDKLKKYFDFTGFEKGGKPKKEKKPKKDANGKDVIEPKKE
ncbi:MAG: hypothetical protein JWO32_1816 [Bacteroidetes bacterium]|nr:hypothetical protein [Bacteroidota bacterium]